MSNYSDEERDMYSGSLLYTRESEDLHQSDVGEETKPKRIVEASSDIELKERTPSDFKADKSLIKHGRTLADHSLAEQMNMHSEGIVCGIKIENRTKYILQDPRLHTISGIVPVSTVDVGVMKDQAIIAKQKIWPAGTSGIVTFTFGQAMKLIILWSLSRFYSNRLGVGIVKTDNIQDDLSPEKYWDIMWNNKTKRNFKYKIKCYENKIDIVSAKNNGYEVKGVMGTGNKVEVQIILRPLDVDGLP